VHRLLLKGYRGDYLESEGFLWAENERERLRALWLDQAIRNAEWMEASELFGNAISLYQQIQLKFPEIETSYFGLMRLFDKLGNSSDVHHQYEKLTRILAEEFDIKPTEKIMKWFRNWQGGSRIS
jgi:two-component SAPR family response regulator